MVLLHIKKDNESQFLYDVSVKTPVEQCRETVTAIYNGALKIARICSEMEELNKHGIMCPPDVIAVTKDESEDVKIVDKWAEECTPVGGWSYNRDPTGRRNGRQPNENMQNVILKAVEEAKAVISKKLISYLTVDKIHDTLELLQGAILIVYPMNIPRHDIIRQELENCEELNDKNHYGIIDPNSAQLWFSGKMLESGKMLCDYVGMNEKTKVVIKITSGNTNIPPPKEPIISEEEQKLMMLHAFRRAEELKKLEQDDDDMYLDSTWADRSTLKRSFHGIGNILWKSK